MPRKDATTGQISAQAQQDLVSEGIENFELPKSIVTKIAKSAIPENAKLQKETILSLVKGSTVFINYLAATAHDVAQSKQHKSISASDVLKALEIIEFGDLVEPLQSELSVYRELAKTDKSKKGSANLTGSAASAPPNAAKKTGTTTPSSAAQQNVTAPAGEEPLKARPKNGKAAGAVSGGSDVYMGESVSAAGGAGQDSEEQLDYHDPIEDDDEDVAGPEGEEVVDTMQIEEEELRRDALGVEERGGEPSASVIM